MVEALEKLAHWGCDIERALRRLLGDEDLLLYCIAQLARDTAFEELGAALKDGETQRAVDAAYSLKGITANTGVDPLHALVSDMVEPARGVAVRQGLALQYQALLHKRDELQAILDACGVSADAL